MSYRDGHFFRADKRFRLTKKPHRRIFRMLYENPIFDLSK